MEKESCRIRAGRSRGVVGLTVWLFVVGCSLCLGILPAGAGEEARPTRQDAVIAEVGGEKITVVSFEERLRQYGGSPSFHQRLQVLTPEGRKEILEGMIRDRLFYQAARKEGIALDEATRRKLEELRRSLLVKRYLEEKLRYYAVTEAEIAAYYEKRRAEFVIPAQVQVSHIIVENKEEAKKIRKELKEGADFAALATQHNIDASRERGGCLGWVRKGLMVAPFEAVAFALPKGEISNIVPTQFGYHLIKVEDIREKEQKSLERVREEIKKRITRERIKELEERQRALQEVKVYKDVLKEFFP